MCFKRCTARWFTKTRINTQSESRAVSKIRETWGLSCSNFNYPIGGGGEETTAEVGGKKREGEASSLKCERSYISLITHPSSSNLLIKQVLQEVKRCVSKPHQDRWHPSVGFERDKREGVRGIKKKRSLSKLVRANVTTTRRRMRLRDIKKNKVEGGLCSTLTGPTVSTISERRGRWFPRKITRTIIRIHWDALSQVCLCAQGLGKQQSDRWHRRLELNGPGDANRVAAQINKYTGTTREQLLFHPSFWPLPQKHLRHHATRITITSKESFGVLQSDFWMQADGNLKKICSDALECGEKKNN